MAVGGPSGRPGTLHAPPPVIVTNVLPEPASVCTTTELCRNPLEREKPACGPAGPRSVSEKNQASWDELSRMAATPSPPAQSAQVERSEYASHSLSRAAASGPAPALASTGGELVAAAWAELPAWPPAPWWYPATRKTAIQTATATHPADRPTSSPNSSIRRAGL